MDHVAIFDWSLGGRRPFSSPATQSRFSFEMGRGGNNPFVLVLTDRRNRNRLSRRDYSVELQVVAELVLVASSGGDDEGTLRAKDVRTHRKFALTLEMCLDTC